MPRSFKALIISLFSKTAFMAFFDSVLKTGALAFSTSFSLITTPLTVIIPS